MAKGVNKKSLQVEQKWNIVATFKGKTLEDDMIHIARDFAAFASLVCFCTTLAVWGDVLFAAA